MDRERLFKQLDLRYTSKREMLSRAPLGTQLDVLWQELINRRRAKSTVLPIFNSFGTPYWYVTTDKMVAASEKIVEAMFENDTDYDPYAEPPVVATLEEVYFTSYIDGAHISIQEAMEFLQSDMLPRDIEEQMIANNRYAGNYASGNLYRMIDEDFLRELANILTNGMDGGGRDYRFEDWNDIPSMRNEEYRLPPAASIPTRVYELLSLLEDIQYHPLIKAAAAQAWMLAVRPFTEGNERLGRLLSNIVLLRSGYSFFADVSLSALIARKSYGYYEAVSNIIREENGGDLTYFFEYYLQILARAVDERRLRLRMKNSDILKAEAEMAQTTLHSMPGESGVVTVQRSARVEMGEHEIASEDDDSFNTDESILAEEDELDSVRLARLRDELYKSAAKGDGKLNRSCQILLKYLDLQKHTFTSADFESDLPVTPNQAGNLIMHLKAKGIIAPTGKEGKYTLYTIQPAFAPLTEADYSPDLLKKIRELSESKPSSKNKRLGAVLKKCLPKGLISASDYNFGGQQGHLAADMALAQSMGLVEKIDIGVFRLLRSLKLEHSTPIRSKKEF